MYDEKIKGKEYITSILEDQTKVVRKILELPNVETPDMQIDTYVIEAKTLQQGDMINGAERGEIKDSLEDAVLQLRGSQKIINDPIRTIHIDARERTVTLKSPNELITKGRLNDLWNNLKNPNTPLDEFWLKLKDASGKEHLWRFYEQNNILKGEVIR
ncbi:hypothetical protein HYY72_04155 [Candidatus Woesearchaeota archaeon]|nr:hypothetical protein [Candidatus Woesearchaeota archaeon]